MSAARIEALTALRDRLAKATGPDWQLSIDIELALNPGATYSALEDTTVYFNGRHYNPPAYTASIDAAVTLVPSRYTNDWDAGVVDEVRAPDDIQTRNYAHIGNTECWGATPALALCLARIEYELAAIAERDS